MDRPVSTPVAAPSPLDDGPASGWDPRNVWQERVRDPHVGASAAPVAPRVRVEDRSAGWDPLETWRLRVHRPRKHSA